MSMLAYLEERLQRHGASRRAWHARLQLAVAQCAKADGKLVIKAALFHAEHDALRLIADHYKLTGKAGAAELAARVGMALLVEMLEDEHGGRDGR